MDPMFNPDFWRALIVEKFPSGLPAAAITEFSEAFAEFSRDVVKMTVEDCAKIADQSSQPCECANRIRSERGVDSTPNT